MGRKLAVLFPGIGYHCDKPLLYYSSRLAKSRDYEVIPVAYGNFPKKVLGDASKMKECFEQALSQTEEILSAVEWETYDEILFFSKSVGTVVSSAYAAKKGLKVKKDNFVLIT